MVSDMIHALWLLFCIKVDVTVDLEFFARASALFTFFSGASKTIGFYAYGFEEWLMVDFRDGLDRAIHSTKLAIRCPTVIMTNYSKMPMRKFRPTKALLYEMQKGICGYSGKKMSMKQMNIEHKHPKSFGGRDTFGNLMLVDTKINHARGNKPLEQVGLRPLFNHREPQALPAAYAIKSAIHPDWNYWLSK